MVIPLTRGARPSIRAHLKRGVRCKSTVDPRESKHSLWLARKRQWAASYPFCHHRIHALPVIEPAARQEEIQQNSGTGSLGLPMTTWAVPKVRER